MKSSMKIGDKTNMLELLKFDGSEKGQVYGIFKCECGVEKRLPLKRVKGGNSKSCGCYRITASAANGRKCKTHGMTGTWIHHWWNGFIQKNNMSEDWLNFEIFYKEIGYLIVKGKQIIPIYQDQPLSLFNCKLVDSEISAKYRMNKTCQEKYGTDYAILSQNVQEKMKQTNIEKYGVDNVFKSKEIQEKIIETNLKKYGETNHMKTKKSQDNVRQKFITSGKAKSFCGKTPVQWAEEMGISDATIHHRLKTMSFEEAVNIPKQKSTIEYLMSNLLDSMHIKYEEQKQIENRYADFYITSSNLLIECDGLYWHSELIKDKKYHKEKKNLYDKNGYKSLFFWEDEISNKIDIVKSIINNAIGNSNIIYGRKCEIIELDVKQRKVYFNENHLMGTGRGKTVALIYNNEIVCALQYLTKNGLLNVERFCSKLNTSVTGGFTKLLKRAIEIDTPLQIQTFIDRRYGSGEYLKNFGFELINNDLSFSWVKSSQRVHRMRFPGHSGYEEGWCKIWDCGQAKWIKTL